jgi:acyl-coenzyme A thioesterase PaaI-like protein
MTFAADTAVTPEGGGRYRSEIRAGWDIGGNANGGYLLALAARAMAHHSGRPDPVTLTAHYLSPGKEGPVSVSCETVKEGRRFATVSARMSAGDRPLLQVLGAFGDLADAVGGPERVEASPPALPPLEECIHSASGPGFAPPFMGRVELYLHPDDAGFRVGQPSGEARMRGWFRLPEAERVEPLGLLLGLDAFPPTIFNARLPVGWTPTVELTCHVRARPEPGWLRAHFTTRFVTGGFLEEDGELWDTGGRLVAQSRQLALVPRPA